MEIKDLALLLAIPVILIALIYYFAAPSITGAAVTQETQNKIIGTYSINPSFKAKIPYDLQDYSKIKKSLDEIIKCVQQGNDVQTCTDSANSNDFDWSLDCDKGAEKVLYDLAELYQDCFESDDKDCICKKNMDIGKDEIVKYGLSGKEFSLTTSQDIASNKISIKFFEPKIDLGYDVKLNGRSVWYPSLYKIKYEQEKLSRVNMFFGGQPQEVIQVTKPLIETGLGPLKEVILYKTTINDIKVVDFVRQEGNNLIYPNNDIKKLENVRSCNLKPKNIYKFCATKKNFKIFAYDNADAQVKERPLTIKFASYIPDSAPEPLKGLEVYEAPKSEKSVLVKWQKSSAKDVTKYRIYYADSSLNTLDKSTDELRKNPEVFTKEIDISSIQVEDKDDFIVPNECEFDYQSKKCIFTALNGAKTFVENNKLYYFKASDSYLYKLDLPEDGKAYDFGITAIDKTGNEINNVNQKMPVIKAIKSLDDLPPDSSMTATANYEDQSKQVAFNLLTTTSKNIDSSKLDEKDFAGYKIYYRKYSKFNTVEEELIASDKLRDSKLNELKPAKIIEAKQNMITIDVSSENPQTDNVFHFVIIAADTNGNPKEEQYKVRELGAVPKKVPIS